MYYFTLSNCNLNNVSGLSNVYVYSEASVSHMSMKNYVPTVGMPLDVDKSRSYVEKIYNFLVA
jgi:hypothetical protein